MSDGPSWNDAPFRFTQTPQLTTIEIKHRELVRLQDGEVIIAEDATRDDLITIINRLVNWIAERNQQ